MMASCSRFGDAWVRLFGYVFMTELLSCSWSESITIPAQLQISTLQRCLATAKKIEKLQDASS